MSASGLSLLNDPTTRRTVAPVAAIAGVASALVTTRRTPAPWTNLLLLAATKTSAHAEQTII